MSEKIDFTRIDEPLVKRAAEVMELLCQSGLTLVTAESCTGGLLSTVLSEAPGAGEHLQGGFVVYTEDQKRTALGVPRDLLEREGAVSEGVARALAEGALARSPADISISITGVAGPARDDDKNPVGLVYLAAAQRGSPTVHLECRFGDIGRGPIRYRSVLTALALVQRAAGIGGEQKNAAE